MPAYIENKSGKCFCGCGLDAPIATANNKKYGHIKGMAMRYIKGHAFRSSSPERTAQGKGKKSQNWKGGRFIDDNGYVLIYSPANPRANTNGYVLEHILVTEKALGHELPMGAVVHHVNEIRNDNEPNNLLICENKGYHHSIHRRKRALESCGSVNGIKCHICKKYDMPENLYIYPGKINGYHKKCYNEHRRNRAHARL